MNKFLAILVVLLLGFGNAKSQDLSELSKVNGNVQIDAQMYNKDNVIKTDDVPEKIRTNSYYYFTYNVAGFTAGLRYEAYMNEILGFEGFRGQGIAHRFIDYKSELLEATLGNFYEQFGSGIILRSYEERQLGWDNSIDGVRFKINPAKGIEIKGIAGKVRNFWENGNGIVRGADASVSVFELFPKLSEMSLIVGASLVSKYEPDQSATLKLPANVMAHSERISLSGSQFSVDFEYAHKINDPMSSVNSNSYNTGNGMVFNASYFPDKLGISMNFHRFDNMDFRSDRGSTGKETVINFLPTLTKQHVYALTSIYPYSTQANGEIGVQFDVNYSLGDKKYPFNLALNYSRVHALDTAKIDEYTYDSPFPGISKNLLYQDISIDLTKRWNKQTETALSYIFLTSNREVLENHPGRFGRVYAHIQAAELLYRFTSRMSLRAELQNMFATQSKAITEEDKDDQTNGNWAMALVELTVAPKWYFSLFDQYNYGNDNPDLRVHYPNAAVAFVHGSTRFSLGYGRQRRGLLCIGGICRQVPSANGFTLSITTSF